MGLILTEAGRRALRMIFERGAESASRALSGWLGEDVVLSVSAIDVLGLERAVELLGPPETLIAAAALGVSGRLSGSIVLAFGDASGRELVDRLLRQPVGTTAAWGELERSALCETANIVGCAFVNALAAHLPEGASASVGAGARVAELAPTPPMFARDFAGGLIESALIEQSLEWDQVVVSRSGFRAAGAGGALDGALLFVPGREALARLGESLARLEREAETGMGQGPIKGVDRDGTGRTGI